MSERHRRLRTLSQSETPRCSPLVRAPLPQSSPQNPPKRIICVGNYDLGNTIGKGQFGKVKLGTHVLTGDKVAIKIISKRKIAPEMVTNLKREVEILKRASHPNIIRLYEVIETERVIFLVMENASGGEVLDFVVTHSRLSEDKAKGLFRQIISAISYCHTLRIVHRDLKAENLLLDKNLNIKLIDFGLSAYFTPGVFMDTPCGSPTYAAPELILKKQYQGPEVDIWSLGVILFVFVSGALPFLGDDLLDLYKKIIKAEVKIPEFLSKELVDLIKRILVADPKKRATLDEIKTHPWVVGDDGWTGVMGMLHLPPVLPELLDQNILNQMSLLGFNRPTVIESLVQRKFNSASSTYTLLQQKATKQQVRSAEPPKLIAITGRRTTSDWTPTASPRSPLGTSPPVSFSPLDLSPPVKQAPVLPLRNSAIRMSNSPTIPKRSLLTKYPEQAAGALLAARGAKKLFCSGPGNAESTRSHELLETPLNLYKRARSISENTSHPSPGLPYPISPMLLPVAMEFVNPNPITRVRRLSKLYENISEMKLERAAPPESTSPLSVSPPDQKANIPLLVRDRKNVPIRRVYSEDFRSKEINDSDSGVGPKLGSVPKDPPVWTFTENARTFDRNVSAKFHKPTLLQQAESSSGRRESRLSFDSTGETNKNKDAFRASSGTPKICVSQASPVMEPVDRPYELSEQEFEQLKSDQQRENDEMISSTLQPAGSSSGKHAASSSVPSLTKQRTFNAFLSWTKHMISRKPDQQASSDVKTPRSVRTVLSNSATSSKDPREIIEIIKKKFFVPYDIIVEQRNTFCFKGTHQNVEFEIEVCMLPNISDLYFIRLQRISGDWSEYKELCSICLSCLDL